MVTPVNMKTPARWNQHLPLCCGTLVMLHLSKDEQGTMSLAVLGVKQI